MPRHAINLEVQKKIITFKRNYSQAAKISAHNWLI